jgi:hypothetical protein
MTLVLREVGDIRILNYCGKTLRRMSKSGFWILIPQFAEKPTVIFGVAAVFFCDNRCFQKESKMDQKFQVFMNFYQDI